MRVYGHHLVCRWWPAQWVFLGGWLVVRDVCHVSTTMPTRTISVAFHPTLHLPQRQPHRTRIRVRCVSMVIISYEVVAGPKGVCWGMALHEGCLPHQHHHANTDNISGRQRCLPPDTPPPPMSILQDTHLSAMHVYSYHLVCRRCPAQWVLVGGRCFRV